ncbi:hypothetical protein [Streptomyces sp. NPDC054787]
MLFFGTGLPGDRWHAAEERVELEALRLGVRTLACFLGELASEPALRRAARGRGTSP